MTRVLVTGAASFTARHLLPLLVSEPGVGEVRASDLPPSASGLGGAAYRPADLTDRAAAIDLARWAAPDVVFHLAGTRAADAAACYAVNLDGTRHLLDACARLPAPPVVCVVSSAAVYGLTHAAESPVSESAPLRPYTVYGASKAAAEIYALSLARRGALPAFVVRPFNLIGPGLPPGLAPSDFVAQALAARGAGDDAAIRTGRLETVRDFVDVRDAARAYVAVARGGDAAGRAFNVASGRGVSIRDLLAAVLAAAGVTARLVVDPARTRSVDVSEQVGDPRALREATGWSAAIPLARSLEDMVRAASR